MVGSLYEPNFKKYDARCLNREHWKAIKVSYNENALSRQSQHVDPLFTFYIREKIH